MTNHKNQEPLQQNKENSKAGTDSPEGIDYKEIGRNSGSDRTQSKRKKCFYKNLSKSQKFTFWLVVFTGLYAIVSVIQGYFIKKSLDVARESADANVASTRAWITNVGTMRFADRPDAPYIIKFTNGGKTPAVNIVVTTEFKVELPESPPPQFSRCPNTNQSTIPFLPAGEPFTLNLQLPKGIGTAPGTLYVHGCLRYHDVLTDAERKTEFCQEVFVGVVCPTNNRME